MAESVSIGAFFNQPAKRKKLVKFTNSKPAVDFYDALKANVNAYFTDRNISQYGDWRMYVKTVVMLSLYFVPLILIATGALAGHTFLFYAAWVVMSIGMTGCGAAVMHDSNHGAYSKNKKRNVALGGLLLNILGGYGPNWRIQHNIMHHTYTNVDGLDEDIDAGVLLRMSPNAKRYKFHKYQHLYCWPLYALMNFFWMTAKDYLGLVRYDKENMLVKEKLTLRGAVLRLTGLKLFYWSYIVVLPILFSGFAWYQVILGWLLLQSLTGLSLASIFQSAHVMGESDYAQPDDSRKMENAWAVHQFENTVNFAPRSKVLSYFIGGLNFQIEHHVFPHICHIHYPQLSKIVKATAAEYGVPYRVKKTFAHALLEHARQLKRLGQAA